jgi:hypothetical protein
VPTRSVPGTLRASCTFRIGLQVDATVAAALRVRRSRQPPPGRSQFRIVEGLTWVHHGTGVQCRTSSDAI